MSEIEAWRDYRRPSERERAENTGIRADCKRPSERERKENTGVRSGFCWLSVRFCDIETEASNMALAELGNKNYATATEASDH